MRIAARVARLERHPGAGCPACRDRRGDLVLHVRRQKTDGTVHPVTGAPQPCGRCGQVPEEVIDVVEVIINTREERERLPPEARRRTSEAYP
jgi:hypothetical protein